VVVRQTAPPVQPLLEAPQPVYRGQAPSEREEYASPSYPARPDSRLAPPAQPAGWPRQQGYQGPPTPPAVRLGAPEFEAAPLTMNPYGPRSPVGQSP
jgi:hypothetical protein